MLNAIVGAVMMMQAGAAAPPCWVTIPSGAAAGPAEQLRALQRLVKPGVCDVTGVAWAAPGKPPTHHLLLWERQRQLLWRVSMAEGGVRWEKLEGATAQRILSASAGGPITPGPRSTGTGRPGLSTAAGFFVKKNAPGTFDAALPVECQSAPADQPAFLTSCTG